MSDDNKKTYATGGYVSKDAKFTLNQDCPAALIRKEEWVFPAAVVRSHTDPTPGTPNHLSD